MTTQDQEKENLLPEPSSPLAHEHDVSDDETSTLAQEEDQDVLKEDYESEDGNEKPPQPSRIRRILDRILGREEETMYHRPSRRHRERRRRGDVGSEMMYEMEEGGQASLSPSRNSSELDLRGIKDAQKRKSHKRNWFRRVLLHGTIIAFLLGVIWGAYNATRKTQKPRRVVELVSNGTSLFAPTTLLISLDGFRADFLQRGLSPTLNSFIKEGVSPLYMLPPFPSVTFVSHYTMATGLYPYLHGIVGNTFWDPALKEEFVYTKPFAMQPKWWGGEPFWATAEKQGIKTAIHMYPGSEAHIGGVELSYVDQFNGEEPLNNKVDRVLGWLDLPGPKSPETIAEAPRPQLIVAYVPNVDADGHVYGPNSTEVMDSIKKADNMLTKIFDGIKERNLTNIVNVVIVSDHGMATTSVDRLIQLDDIIDMDAIEHTDGWPLYGLRPKRKEDLQPLYHALKTHAEENPYFKVYLRDEDMPTEYHFHDNPRIAPLWIVPETGWAIVKKDEFDVERAKKEGLVFSPRGIHGYDYRHPLMRAIFVARGPAFPHQPHSRIEAFDNRNVYNIICDSVGIEPVPNNGTIRLPLKPIGLHSDPDAPKLEAPTDFPDSGTGPLPTPSPPSLPTKPVPPIPPHTPTVPPPPPNSEQGDLKDEDEKPKSQSIWDWFFDTWDDLRDRISEMLGGDKKDRQ